MSKSLRIPAYRLHKPKNLAVVRLEGRDIYLGPYGSDQSRELYDRLIAEWLARGRQPEHHTQPSAPSGCPAVSVVMLAYLEWARAYYRAEDGDGKEFVNLTHALRPVRELYGSSIATEFGPLALKAVREHMITVQGLCRAEINKRIGRIRRMFKWAVAEELIPASVLESLKAVDGLRRGRTDAREKPPVRPVDDMHVDAILPFIAPPVAAMIQLQRLTGMRPGEVVQLRPCDIEQSGDVWFYSPERHKTEYLDHEKQIPLGPQAQAVLRPYLDRPVDAYCFSPREAESVRSESRAAHRRPNRKTKIYPSELRARERRKAAAKQRVPKRPKRECYDVDSYRRAITYGLKKAKKLGYAVEHWHPHQLRHSRATDVRRLYGVEAAQVVLGHSRADVTQIYAERNTKLAERIAREIG